MDKKFLEKLIIVTCNTFDIHPSLLFEKCRKWDIKLCRWIVWEIMSAHGSSLHKCAAIFGDYDHSSVINCLDTLQVNMNKNEEAAAKYKAILKEMGISKTVITSFRNLRAKRKENKNKKYDGNPLYISNQNLKKKMMRYRKSLLKQSL